MAKKLYEESAVKAIADAIRAKNGGSATYKISEMAAAVGALGASEKLPAAEYPDYVKAGALEVARKVAAVRKSSSIVFAAFSDPHHATDETTGWKTAIETGNRDGCRALRALAHVLPLDFAVFLGDLTFGHYTTTAAQFEAQCKEFHGWADEALRGVPAFWTPGNHDTGWSESGGLAFTKLFHEQKFVADVQGVQTPSCRIVKDDDVSGLTRGARRRRRDTPPD